MQCELYCGASFAWSLFPIEICFFLLDWNVKTINSAYRQLLLHSIWKSNLKKKINYLVEIFIYLLFWMCFYLIFFSFPLLDGLPIFSFILFLLLYRDLIDFNCSNEMFGFLRFFSIIKSYFFVVWYFWLWQYLIFMFVFFFSW